jgi:predicted transcriptional regulator
MLKEILRIINSGMVSMSDIAEQTGATEPMVQQAISLLASKGYLATTEIDLNGEAHCTGCPNHCKIKQHSGKDGYVVTKKGRDYIAAYASAASPPPFLLSRNYQTQTMEVKA